jgi:hypothetical protein
VSLWISRTLCSSHLPFDDTVRDDSTTFTAFQALAASGKGPLLKCLGHVGERDRRFRRVVDRTMRKSGARLRGGLSDLVFLFTLYLIHVHGDVLSHPRGLYRPSRFGLMMDAPRGGSAGRRVLDRDGSVGDGEALARAGADQALPPAVVDPATLAPVMASKGRC